VQCNVDDDGSNTGNGMSHGNSDDRGICPNVLYTLTLRLDVTVPLGPSLSTSYLGFCRGEQRAC
jgi:hypothetical protein